MREVEECYLRGDGANWVKEGCSYFPGAVYRIGPYHLSKVLLEGLGHDEEGYAEVVGALQEENFEKLNKALADAEKRAKGAKKKQVMRVRQYLNNNWEGFCFSKAAVRLGVIEGQVFYHVARRIKRHGARWGERGADHLCRVLAKKANGELKKSLRTEWKTKTYAIKSCGQTT